MAVEALSNSNFEQLTGKHDIVVMEFYADWCAPCKDYQKTLLKLSEAHQDILFCKVDIEAEPELANDFAVRSVPLLIIMREQIAVFMDTGVMPEAALQDLIKQTRELDMDEVVLNLAQESVE